MIEGKFDVVFRGQTVKSFELDTVKTNMVQLFKSSPEAIERLFSGNEVTIRKGLDYTAAMKYQAALRNAGALALIKEVEASADNSASAQPAEPQAKTESKPNPFLNPDPEPEKAAPAAAPTSESQPTQVTQPIAPAAPQVAAEAGSSGGEEDWSLADTGSQIMPDKVYEKKDVDTSALSLAAAGERIMPEKEQEDIEQPNIDHLKLSDND